MLAGKSWDIIEKVIGTWGQMTSSSTNNVQCAKYMVGTSSKYVINSKHF